MSFTKMQIVLAKILGMTVFILAAALVMIPAAAYSDAGGKPVWDKRYKYTWMKWGQEYWPTKPVRGGYFRTAAARYVGYMNPNHWPVNDWTVISHFYEGITGTDGKYNQKNPWLMAYWEYPDPLTVIMKFKEGIKFHDGSPMNAASVKYQIEWMKDKRNGCWTRADLRRFKSIEVVDEYRLRWRTKEPWASFPTGFFAFIISAEALKGDVLIREAKNEAARAKRLKKQAAASGKEEDRKAAARAEEEARAAAAPAPSSSKKPDRAIMSKSNGIPTGGSAAASAIRICLTLTASRLPLFLTRPYNSPTCGPERLIQWLSIRPFTSR